MTEFWDRTYSEDPEFFGAGASSLARSSLGLLLREAAGGSLVELGCGTGRDLVYFASHGFEVRGCDLSAVAVRESNRRVSELRDEVPPRSRAVRGDALELLERLPAGRTDVVFSNLFYNLEVEEDRLDHLFRAVARALRPEGFHLYAVRSTADPWYARGREVRKDVYDPGTGGPPLRFFDEALLRELAEGQFDVLSLREHAEGAPEFPVVIWSAVTRRRAEVSPRRP